MSLDPSVLRGTYFAGHGDEIVVLSFPGDDSSYLPCFTSKELLEESLNAGGIEWDYIHTIEDPDTFWVELHSSDLIVKVILDLHEDEEGVVQYVPIERVLN